MNPAHHLDRSQHYLDFVPANLAAGDCARAAKALARSASHAVTAAAVHWHHGHHSRRRLTTALGELVYTRRIAYSHLRTFHDVYRLIEQVVDLSPDEARRSLRTLRRRVSRLQAAIAGAIANQPEVLTLEQLIADPSLLPEPEPNPEMTTIGELKDALGEYIYTARRSHPIDCPGCRVNYHGPSPARAV